MDVLLAPHDGMAHTLRYISTAFPVWYFFALLGRCRCWRRIPATYAATGRLFTGTYAEDGSVRTTPVAQDTGAARRDMHRLTYTCPAVV